MSSVLARPKSVILGVPSAVEQDVGRLQVAVDDARPVRLGDAAREPSRSARPPAAAGQGVPSSRSVEAAAVDEFQREERQAVGLADLVDLHDVGVLQAGRRPRPRPGSEPTASASAWAPARIIFRARGG